MTRVNLISLTKTYTNQRIPVLKDFSLSVDDGEMVALLGPSGSGKSTLLKLIAGIERPEAGDIQFDDSSILSIPPNKRGAVFMFQKSYLFPFLNVAENIGFGLKVQARPAETIRTEVARMLDLIGLPGTERRKPSQLSGGEQQRVALARALVTNPKLLLLDEPLNSLDATVRLNLQEAIRNIQRELGITTIMVTHDLDEAMAMSDRMALLIHGKVAAFDRPNVLFQRPPCVETAKFVGVTTFVDGKADHGWLDSALGRLKIGDEKKAGRAVYAIRPEHIRIQKETCENALAGVVQSCLYRGEHMEYQVSLGETIVRARVPAASEFVPHGAQVQVVLPREHLFEVRSCM